MRRRTVLVLTALSLIAFGTTVAWVQEALEAPVAAQANGVLKPRPGPATAANTQRAIYLESLYESALARDDQRVTRSDGALHYVANLWPSWPSYRVLHAAMAELSIRQSIGLECSGTAGENFRSTWIVGTDNGEYYIFTASSESFAFRLCNDGGRTFTAAMKVAEKIVHTGKGTGVENQIDGTCSALTLFKNGRCWTKLSYGYDDETRASWSELRRVLFGLPRTKSKGEDLEE